MIKMNEVAEDLGRAQGGALQVVSSAELDHGHRDRGQVCFLPSSVKWAPRICLCYILASKSESIMRLST